MSKEKIYYILFDNERYYVSEETTSRNSKDAKIFSSIEEIITTATIYNDWQDYKVFMHNENGWKKVPEAEWEPMYRARRDKEIAKLISE